MPQPRISSQPVPLQNRQPSPAQMPQRHVDLGRRLGEREEVRAEARPALRAEQRLDKVLERALEVAERDALVDDESLDLGELRQVAGVGDVAAIDLAGSDDVDGRLAATP